MISTLLLAYILQFQPIWLAPYKPIYEHVQISAKLMGSEQSVKIKLMWRF